MKKSRKNDINKSRQKYFHLMLFLPCLILFIFNYLPIFGLTMVFQDFKPGLGFFGSKWVGLDNFRTIFKLPDFPLALRNTLFIAVGKIIGNIVFPVSFALMLNELRGTVFKRTAQTISYLPYFLSWVVLAGVLTNLLTEGNTESSTGLLNTILIRINLIESPISFLGDKNIYPWTMIVSDIWKNFGYNTIVYLAALTGIDPGLYEAAAIDGANRWRQTLHVTLPGILPIVILMTVLGIGNIMNAGFDQIFTTYSPNVYETGDILDTLVYRLGLVNMRYSLSATVGCFKSVVSGLLIVLSYKLADRFAGYRVF